MAKQYPTLLWRSFLVYLSGTASEVDDIEPNLKVLCFLVFEYGELILNTCLLFGDFLLFRLPKRNADFLIEAIVVKVVQTPL